MEKQESKQDLEDISRKNYQKNGTIVFTKTHFHELNTKQCKLEKDDQKVEKSESDNDNQKSECDYETQKLEVGEADLHTFYNGCVKDPGHQNFVPVNVFTLKDLPESHQDTDLYECVKAAANLTVRVDVRMVSPDRPKFWPNTDVPYPFYKMRGQTNLRYGTGAIRCVYTRDDVRLHGSCPCRNCKESDRPRRTWWKIALETASHVVFDSVEASQTSIRLFYDRDGDAVVTLHEISVINVNVVDDRCMLYCGTCDKHLRNKIYTMWKHFDDVWRRVYDKYKTSRDTHKLMFIVSHPHGCSKQVSIGQWKDRYPMSLGADYCKFTYTTSTCPGSSGATVNCVGFDGGLFWWYHPVHSGTLVSGINYSGVGWVE